MQVNICLLVRVHVGAQRGFELVTFTVADECHQAQNPTNVFNAFKQLHSSKSSYFVVGGYVYAWRAVVKFVELQGRTQRKGQS